MNDYSIFSMYWSLVANLNFKHLRYFWMVAKSGSVAGASQHLHLTPQSISGQLGELEDSLGADLFRRVGRGLELTEKEPRHSGLPRRTCSRRDKR